MPPEEICLASKSSTKSYVCSLTDIEKGAVSIDATFSPHLCVGFLFLILFPASAAAASSAASLSHTTLSPTVFHTQLCHPPSFTHTTLSPTIFHTHNFVTHTQLCHTSSFTHNFVTHHLSHTTLSPTICHTHNFVTHHLSHTTLSHTTLSHTHNFVTHNFVTHKFVTHLSHTTLSHTIFHNFVTHHLSHTTLSPIFHTQLCHTPSFTTLSQTLFHTQLCHPSFTSPRPLRGRRGTYGTGLALVARLGWDWSPVAALCVAGVALGDIHLRFAWQAWHLETSTFVLRGRRGTYGTGLALVARLGWDWSLVTPQHFAWQAWHLATPTFVSRGRCGTWRHLPRFAWQLWHLWHWAGSGGALGLGSLCVAGVALGDIHLRFTWQVWHLETSTFVLRGSRDTSRHPPSFCVAGVALMALGWLWWRA